MSDTQAAETQETGNAGSEIEARARNMGWRPLEEFRGDQSAWKDAAEFVRTAEANLPVMNERYKALEGRYFKDTTDLRQELQGVHKKLGETQQVLTEFREFASRGEQRAYERAKRELLAKQETAVAHADTETYKETQRELAELEQSARPVAPVQTEQRQVQQPTPVQQPAAPAAPDPAVTQWIGNNTWFNTDLELRAAAIAVDSGLMASQPALPAEARLAAVKERMQHIYPEKFENQRRNGPAPVNEPNSPANPRRNPKAKTFSDLPADAQGACDRIVRTMADAAKGKNVKAYTREDYVREYFAGEE